MNPDAIAKVQAREPDKMLSMIERMATDPACDPAKLREILAVKKDWEADEARKAFSADMASFQARCPIIAKLENANGKNYARIDRIYRETRPLRTECGFWFVWNSCEIKGEIAHIEGLLGHRGGHTIPCRQIIPLPEEIISKSGFRATNAAQRAGSAESYAKRYGECLALGIVTGEDNDGNSPKSKDPTRELLVELWNLLKGEVPEAPKDADYSTKWLSRNQWLWANEILDGATEPPELAQNLSAEQLKQVIEKVKGLK